MRDKETVHGYEIRESTVFDNNRGFALAENPAAPQKFVTWQFTEDENGARDYYWGHYTNNGDTARRDYNSRVADYIKDYGQTERGVYKYYSTQRPIDIGTFPRTPNEPIRIVNFEAREGVELGYYQAWGYLEYAAPLTEKQLDDYELKAAHNNPDIKKRVQKQTQIVGEWEDKRKAPANLRFTEWTPDFKLFIKKAHVTPEQIAERYKLVIEAKNRPRPIAEQFAEAEKKVRRGEKPRTEKPSRNNEDRT
jgi:hypothetical protein